MSLLPLFSLFNLPTGSHAVLLKLSVLFSIWNHFQIHVSYRGEPVAGAKKEIPLRRSDISKTSLSLVTSTFSAWWLQLAVTAQVVSTEHYCNKGIQQFWVFFFPCCGKKNTSQLYFGDFIKQVAKFPLIIFQVSWLPREDQAFSLSFYLNISHAMLIQATFFNFKNQLFLELIIMLKWPNTKASQLESQ